MADDGEHELTSEDKRILKYVADAAREEMPSRRGFVQGTSAAVALGALGFGAGSATAQTQPAAGQVGTESNLVDVEAATVNTGVISSNLNDGQHQAAIAGLVVPVGQGVGVGDAVDPSSTPTPVQEAMDKLNSGGDVDSGDGGMVLLPPTTVDEQGPINQRAGVSIRGWNGLTGGTSGNSSVSAINITNDDSASAFDIGADDADGFRWDSFAIIGSGLGNGISPTPCIKTSNHGPSDWGWDNLTIDEWRGKVLDCTEGIFQVDCGSIRILRTDAGDRDALFHFQNAGPDVRFREIVAYPSRIDSGSDNHIMRFDSSGAAGVRIDSFNIGGEVDAIIRTGDNFNHYISVGYANYEPGTDKSDFTGAIYEMQVGGFLEVGMTFANDANDVFSNVSRGLEIERDTEFDVGPFLYSGSNPFTTSEVGILDDLDPGLHRFGGLAADVDNDSGAVLSNGVFCAADMTRKVSTGTGYDGGTDDSRL